MRNAAIQTIQRLLRKRYNKEIVEVMDPFHDMKTLLRSADVRFVVDGGAYHGEIALKLADMFPRANIYAFEPAAGAFGALGANVRANARIHPVRMGLSSREEVRTLYINAQDSANALSRAAAAGKLYQGWQTETIGSEEVRLTTIDRWVAEQDVPGIDVIKLDLQGHELEALRGAREALRSSVKMVYTEVEFVRVYEENCLMHELEAFLQDEGFDLYQLYNLTSGEDGQLVCGDALFIARGRLRPGKK